METTELSAAEARETLTARDLEVVAMTSRGTERTEIAEVLGVSLSGVARHMTKALRLTGAKNGAHLVALLITDGRLPSREIRERAESIVLNYVLSNPVDEVEQHVNDIVLMIARELGTEL